MLAPEQRHSLELRIDQKVIQAARLLQYNTVELENAIEQELVENPALERIESAPDDSDVHQMMPRRRNIEFIYEGDGGDASDVEADPISNAVDESLTLREYLSRELHAQLPERQYALAEYILDNLDERGLLPGFNCERASLETGASPEEIEEVLRVLQSMDPPGVGARSVQECMLLQLRYLHEQGQGNPLAEQIVERCFPRLVAPSIRQIARELRASPEEVANALKYIRDALHPYPAYRFRTPWGTPSSAHQSIIKPDVIIRRNPQGFEVEIVRPRWILIVSPQWREQYEKIRNNPSAYPKETIRQVEEYVERAQRFMRNIEIRYRTLYRVTRAVIDHQFAFLETGSHTFLKPLTRTQIAAQLNVHESTVSRAISNKWVLIPTDDLVPFSDFFTPALNIQQAIHEVIHSEDPFHPYSDQQIADILYERWGISTTRRTIVKHRNRLHIPSSRDRKKRR
ncbi:MAG: RNA polymerase factor sigma-54 [Armatimonadota bacterium]|nr:RNA polymerase factor sigma-54 [bacterium]MDW8320874.1 RNA polymerase factor sigma-54 [Armatimonadota bacterium]